MAVSIFDNETGDPANDGFVQGLSDVVVTRLTALAPGRVGVVGNAAPLRQPRNIRNLKTLASSLDADYIVLGQLQRQNDDLRFIVHFIRLRDGVHLSAQRFIRPPGEVAAIRKRRRRRGGTGRAGVCPRSRRPLTDGRKSLWPRQLPPDAILSGSVLRLPSAWRTMRLVVPFLRGASCRCHTRPVDDSYARCPWPAWPAPPCPRRPGASAPCRLPTPAADWLPRQDPALAKETVGVSHRDIKRVRELVERHPALARAAVDWGFGDWETALGAASHTGRREIAEFLLANGAQPTMFSAAMLGQLDVVKAFVTASPGIQGTHGPHGITLLAHAKAGGPGSAAVVTYLESVGGADVPTPTQPLPPADRDAVVGRYTFGPGPRDHFVIDVQSDRLGIERPDSDRRLLLHAGDLVFFTPGVPSVRIAFAREGSAVARFTIADPQVVLTATRA